MAEESAPGQNGLSLLTCTREVRRRQCTFECTCNQGYCTIGGITSAPVDLENSIEYPMFTRLTSVWCLVTEMIMFHPYDPCMVYLPTCCWFLRTLTIKINQMKVNIPYVDPMGPMISKRLQSGGWRNDRQQRAETNDTEILTPHLPVPYIFGSPGA